MYNNDFRNNDFRNNEVVYESTVDARIIPVRDGEAMVFEVELGPFKMVCISNIPEEGKTTAPAYLKFKMNDGRSSNGYRKRFPRQDRVSVDYVRGGNRGGNGHDDENRDGRDNNHDDT